MTAEQQTFWSWATPPRLVAIALAVLVLVGLAMTPADPDFDPQPGDVVAGNVFSDEGSVPHAAPLMFGLLDLRLDIDDVAMIDGEEVASPRDTRWVQVEWQVEQINRPAPIRFWPDATAAEEVEAPSRLTLVAGGTSYPLADRIRSSDEGGSVTLLVADAQDARLMVSTDGVDRRAEVVEDSEFDETRECAEFSVPMVDLHISCAVDVARHAYVPGLDWAPQGKEWLVVAAGADGEGASVGESAVSEESYDSDSVDYFLVGKPAVSVEVDGVPEPTRTHGGSSVARAGVKSRTMAYLVPANVPVKVGMTFTGRAEPDPDEKRPPGAPGHVDITAQEERIAVSGS